MADIFISYSRKDVDFVRKLHQTLVDQNLSVWVDWDGIPPSAEWLAEIFQAIEAAGSFIFVVSQASGRSEICQLELQHAIKHNKRLIPVVIEALSGSDVPDDLAKLHWLFFRPDDDFEQSSQSLLTAINTDLDWVKAHTGLLNKSIEWDSKAHEKSLLLRGKELAAVEKTVTENRSKAPELTALQNSYLTVSRESATQRTRMLYVGFALLALIIGGISWFAYQQSLAKEAELKSGVIKQARLLASQARQQPRDAGILGAIEAAKLLSTVSTEVDTTVHNALLEKARMYRFEPRAKPNDPKRNPRVSSFGLGVGQLAFSEDNKLLGAYQREEAIRRWQLCLDQSGNALCGEKPQKDLIVSVPQRVATGISHTGTKGVIADGKQLTIYQLSEQAKVQCRKPLSLDNIYWYQNISDDEGWSVIPYGSSWEHRYIVNIQCDENSQQSSGFRITGDASKKITASALHPDNKRLFIGLSNGDLQVHKLEDNSGQSLDNVFEDRRRIEQMVISDDGRWLAVSHESAVYLVDLQQDQLRARKVCCEGGDTRFGLAFNHASTRLAVYYKTGQQRQIALRDITNPEFPQLLTFNIPYKQHDEPNVYAQTIAFSKDDQWMAAGLGGDNYDVLLWPLKTEDLIQLACRQLDDKNKCPQLR